MVVDLKLEDDYFIKRWQTVEEYKQLYVSVNPTLII